MATNHLRPAPPHVMLRELLQERGWTQEELATIIGRSPRAISELIRGRSGVTPEMANSLAAAFGNTPEEWLFADSNYRLSLISTDVSEIQKRAELFSLGPLREMEKRGWINYSEDAVLLERELNDFFSLGANQPPMTIAARRSMGLPALSSAEAAWCFRARRLASTLLVSQFNEARLPKARSELRKLASHPKEARSLPQVLASFGIRFVVVEPLSACRIDGAAFWDETGPVIAVSIRHDRIDGFWFTVMHEFSHIAHKDPISVDSGLVDAETGVAVRLAGNEVEERADSEAANALIAKKEIESFIRRVGPLYSRDRVVQFANRIRIHPGIIVGQLQHRKEIGYAALRDMLVKVRDNVTSTAVTDGWGQIVSPSVTRR